ncbi:MalY/PatB family protein [Vibrio fluminensis]|uniref:MalY/PatB family protein n=1 Tax=Vibrio fluminensis TaxID=2783614 RepID=UPI0018886232|nr:MalY/PatB family protein [Vibrio fluminensis]
MFDKEIDRRGTYCTQWDYVQDRFGEADLLPFTISDMDFAAPECVLNAINERTKHPVWGYSRWNHDDYKDAVTYWFKKRFDAQFDRETLVYGPSVIYIISQLIRQWSAEHQGVVIHTPAYDAFGHMLTGLNRQAVKCELFKSGTKYEKDWQQFEVLLAKPENTILLLCSPHNPTGKVWTREELQRIALLCERHQVAVISDEIHMDISFQPHTPWQGFSTNERWALVSSASKSFNIPALNGAYAFIADTESRERYLVNLKQVDGLSSPPILGVLGLMAAYNDGEQWLDELKDYLLDNHQYVKRTLEHNFPQLSYDIPEATYLAWINLAPLNIDMEELNIRLVKQYKVAIMQGSHYGEQGQSYIRMNLGCSRRKVERGIEALIQAINDLIR